MAPKHHPTPLSGGDRKALQKELGHARAMTTNLATQAAEARAKGEALIRQADRLLPSSPGTSFSGRPHSGTPPDRMPYRHGVPATDELRPAQPPASSGNSKRYETCDLVLTATSRPS